QSCAITELEGEEWSEPSDLRLWTRQGPLDSGALRDMGGLQGMVDHVLAAHAGTDADSKHTGHNTAALRSVVIQVIAMHGGEDLPIGAERTFDVLAGGTGPALRPRTHGA